MLFVEVVVLGHQDPHRQHAAGTVGSRGRFLSRRGPGRDRLAVGPAHHPVDRLEQLLLLDWLEQMGFKPQAARPDQVAGAVPRGQEDDTRSGQLGLLTELGG